MVQVIVQISVHISVRDGSHFGSSDFVRGSSPGLARPERISEQKTEPKLNHSWLSLNASAAYEFSYHIKFKGLSAADRTVRAVKKGKVGGS